MKQKFLVLVKREIVDKYEITAEGILEAADEIRANLELLNYEDLAKFYPLVEKEASDPKVSGIEFSIFDIVED